MVRHALTALLSPLSFATEGIVYAPLNLWPYPKEVKFSDPLGPHALQSPQVTVEGCDSRVNALADKILAQKVVFRDTVRSFDEKPYALKDAFCPKNSACAADADCADSHTCMTDGARRYNSSHACPPSAAYNSPCGCCVAAAGPPRIPSISISCSASDRTEEAYELSVSESAVDIRASSAKGAAYALATLSQLLHWEPSSGLSVLDRVPLQISDEPTYSWRGVMVDTSRSFVPTEQLLELLDAMFAAKLNIFHWHIVDSPSFPYESTTFPELAREGSWSQDASTIYDAAALAKVVQHARDRFVEVVFEFDTPAHTMAWGRSHPEIMTDCWRWLAQENPKVDVDSTDCMAMDPTAPAAEPLVTKLVTEVIQTYAADSRFLHLGGDEVKVGCWNASNRVRAAVEARYGDLSDTSFKTLQRDWTKNISDKAVLANKKTPVIWQPTEDGATDPVWKPSTSGLSNETVYMIWLSGAAVAAYAQAGAKVVNTQPFYVAGMGAGGWKSVYDAEVAPSSLSESERNLVLGGQICMWGETMAAGNFGMRAYQIGMGAAENFWGKNPSGESGGWALQTRFNRFLCHLKNWDIEAPPQMPGWCGVLRTQAETEAMV